MNRCCACNKFCKWEDLSVDSFEPDSHFGGEDAVYICILCKKDEIIKRLENENRILNARVNGVSSEAINAMEFHLGNRR